MNIFVPIIIIGILTIITVLLMSIDQLLGGSKEKTITINGTQSIPVTETDTVLNTLSKEKIFIPSACGGKATCGACKFRLIDGGGDIKPTEEPFLSEKEKKDGVRLSCQVKVNSDMEIELPLELMNAKEYQTKVVKIEDLTYDIKLIRLAFIEPKSMEFLPGQYAQIKVPGIEVVRAYSIASDPKDNAYIEFIIRYVPKGKATTYVHKALMEGDKVIITGPYGDFYLQEDSTKDIIMIAGGSGKAPILSILNRLEELGMKRKVRYFFGAKAVKDLYLTDYLQDLEKKYPNFEYIPALSEPDENDEWEGETGLITEVVKKHTVSLKDAEAYLCGSPGMIDACIDVLMKKEMPVNQIYFDKFS